jgi:hypothetical protein
MKSNDVFEKCPVCGEEVRVSGLGYGAIIKCAGCGCLFPFNYRPDGYVEKHVRCGRCGNVVSVQN